MPKLVGQAEAGNAVNNAEIDRLGAAAHFGGHVLDRHAENFRRRHGVNIQIVGKGLLQFRDIGDMRQQPQFDLAVIGADQLAALGRDEGLADAAAFFGAHRDVLQIGIGGGQPPGRGRRHGVGGMNPPRLGIDVAGQRVGIGAAQFGQAAPLQHFLGDGMALGRRHLPAHRCRWTRPRSWSCARLSIFMRVEQDFAQLLG